MVESESCADLMLSSGVVGIELTVVLALKDRAEDRQVSNGNWRAIYYRSVLRGHVGLASHRKIAQDIRDCGVGGHGLEGSQAARCRGKLRRGRSLAMQGGVLIRAEEEELVLNYRAAESAPEPVVIKRRLRGNRPALDGGFRQIIHRIQVSVLRVPLAGTMPIVRTCFGDQNKLASRGMAVFRAKLVRQ